MMFQPYFMVLTPLNPFFQDQIDKQCGLYSKCSLLADINSIDTQIKPGQQSEIEFNSKIYDLVRCIKENSDKYNEITSVLNRLSKNLEIVEDLYNSIIAEPQSHQKESSIQTYTEESQSLRKTVSRKVDNNRTHPKVKLMQKIFGKKEYSYKLAYDGKFPKILFKQRNISLRILLKDLLGENVINGNKISLNLKVFKNNGEQIVSDTPDWSFMEGICQTQIKSGVGMFSKIHPRQVSRGFSGKGICIIIYATSQQNQWDQKGLIIPASLIKPLIFYNVKVVVKQNKLILKNKKFSSGCDSSEQN